MFNSIEKNQIITLNSVKPTRSLVFLCQGSKQCEQQTAAIRNSTVKSMNKNDVRGVAYRYLQNRAGENATFWIGMIWAILFVGLIYVFYSFGSVVSRNHELPLKQQIPSEIKFVFMVYMLSLCLANVLPNVCNTLRYRETARGCEQWLEAKFTMETQKIKALGYDCRSFFKLNKLLDKNNIPPADKGDMPGYFKFLMNNKV